MFDIRSVCPLLSGECLPESGGIQKSFHLTPPQPPSLARLSVCGRRADVNLRSCCHFNTTAVFFTPWEEAFDTPATSSSICSVFTCLWRESGGSVNVTMSFVCVWCVFSVSTCQKVFVCRSVSPQGSVGLSCKQHLQTHTHTLLLLLLCFHFLL